MRSYLYILFLFLLSSVLFVGNVRADTSCYFNKMGDYLCPGNSSDNTALGDAPDPTSLSSDDIFGEGGLLFDDLSSVPGLSTSVLSELTSLFDGLPASLQDAFLSEIMGLISDEIDNDALSALLFKFAGLEDQYESLYGVTCGGSGGDLLAYAASAMALNIAMNGVDDFDLSKVTDELCGSSSGGGGGGDGSLPECGPGVRGACLPPGSSSGSGDIVGGISLSDISITGEGGERIAQAALGLVDYKTSDLAGTEGGALGCARGVSVILEKAGYPITVGSNNFTNSTIVLYDTLNADPCYEIVDQGHIDSSEAMNLQRGDVFVTKKATNYGHTGIYVGDGRVVSNTSSGFTGTVTDPTKKGTIQNNYSITSWNSGVISRNPSGSAVFRRVCP